MSSLNEGKNSLWIRETQKKDWLDSETNKEPTFLRNKDNTKVKFHKNCVFLAACSGGDTDEIERQLKNGSEIDTANIDGLTALHQACIDDDLEMVEYLVDRGASIEVTDAEGWSPLHAAAFSGKYNIIKFLLEKGADPLHVNNDTQIPIDILEEKFTDCFDLFNEYIERTGRNATEARSEEETLMQQDANKWLEQGINGETIHPITHATALHVAASKGYLKVMKTLFSLGVDINAQDCDGWTALHAAAHWSEKEACQLLVINGCDMTIKTKEGWTAIDVCCEENLSMLKDLRKKQANINKELPKLIIENRNNKNFSRRSSVTRMNIDDKQRITHSNLIEEAMDRPISLVDVAIYEDASTPTSTTTTTTTSNTTTTSATTSSSPSTSSSSSSSSSSSESSESESDTDDTKIPESPVDTKAFSSTTGSPTTTTTTTTTTVTATSASPSPPPRTLDRTTTLDDLSGSLTTSEPLATSPQHPPVPPVPLSSPPHEEEEKSIAKVRLPTARMSSTTTRRAPRASFDHDLDLQLPSTQSPAATITPIVTPAVNPTSTPTVISDPQKRSPAYENLKKTVDNSKNARSDYATYDTNSSESTPAPSSSPPHHHSPLLRRQPEVEITRPRPHSTTDTSAATAAATRTSLRRRNLLNNPVAPPTCASQEPMSTSGSGDSDTTSSQNINKVSYRRQHTTGSTSEQIPTSTTTTPVTSNQDNSSLDTRNRFNDMYLEHANLAYGVTTPTSGSKLNRLGSSSSSHSTPSTHSTSATSDPSSTAPTTTSSSSSQNPLQREPVKSVNMPASLQTTRQQKQEQRDRDKLERQRMLGLSDTNKNGSLTGASSGAGTGAGAGGDNKYSDGFTARYTSNRGENEEKEIERKTKARKARISRRSTQGVTKDDVARASIALSAATKGLDFQAIKQAEDRKEELRLSNLEKLESQNSTNNNTKEVTETKPQESQFMSRFMKETEAKEKARNLNNAATTSHPTSSSTTTSSSSNSIPSTTTTTTTSTSASSNLDSTDGMSVSERIRTSRENRLNNRESDDKTCLTNNYGRSRRKREVRRSTGFVTNEDLVQATNPALNKNPDSNSSSRPPSSPLSSPNNTRSDEHKALSAPSGSRYSSQTSAYDTGSSSSATTGLPSSQRYISRSERQAAASSNNSNSNSSSANNSALGGSNSGSSLYSSSANAAGSTYQRSSYANNDVTDYKKLYEDEKAEKEKLIRENLRKNDSSLEKRERRNYERKIADLEEEVRLLRNEKSDNVRLKQENAALVRVISKLSK